MQHIISNQWRTSTENDSDTKKDQSKGHLRSQATRQPVKQPRSSLFHPYLGDLDTPVEQQLRSDVVLVLMDIVEQAPVRHQLCDQLDGGTKADTQQADQVGVLHARHDQGLLNETDTHWGMWGENRWRWMMTFKMVCRQILHCCSLQATANCFSKTLSCCFCALG